MRAYLTISVYTGLNWGGIVAALAMASQQNRELGYDSDVGASRLDQHSRTPSMDHGGLPR